MIRVIGYAYCADVHCIECALRDQSAGVGIREGRHRGMRDEHGMSAAATDREGNPVHAMFSTDEYANTEHCGDCHAPLLG